MQRVRILGLGLVASLTMGLPLVGGIGPASASGTTLVGVYNGPAIPSGPADHDTFATWLNGPVPYAVDFLDHHKTWNDIADPDWCLDNWAPWVKADPRRQLVLSVPLLIDSSAGQLRQGANGAFDVYFRTLTENLVSRGLGSSIIRLGWEMNNYGMPWSANADPAAYKDFYARIVTVMRSVPGATLKFDWTVLAGVQGGSSLTTFESFYPGDAYVDIVGFDHYDIKWMDTTSTPAERWSWMLTRPMGLYAHQGFAAAHGKPLSFPEWGLYRTGDSLGGGGDNPYFLDRMADWFTTSNAVYQAYFNADWGGGTLASFPNGQATYQARFKAAVTSTTTAPTTTTPTTVAPTTTTTPTTVAPTTTTTPTTVAPTTTTTPTTVAPTTTTSTTLRVKKVRR